MRFTASFFAGARYRLIAEEKTANVVPQGQVQDGFSGQVYPLFLKIPGPVSAREIFEQLLVPQV